MLSADELEFIRSACSKLDVDGQTSSSVAAVHRILPVYQVYSERDAKMRGHAPAHDALVGISRLLRRRPGATVELVGRQIERAEEELSVDLSLVREREGATIAESLVEETLSALSLVFEGWRRVDLESYVQASLTALEIDLIWAEGASDSVVSWDGLIAQYGWQVRDLKELASVGEDGASGVYRTVAMRAEREGVVYLERMRSLMKSS
jgi:hypothetical protein